jgi:formate dehydrogenase maturation protein FdhE
MTPPVAVQSSSRYAQRKQRANDLAQRWSFAAETLRFYCSLLEVQQPAHERALAAAIDPIDTAAFAAENVLPRVVEVSATHGPPALQQGVLERFDAIDFEKTIRAWLHGEPLDAFDRYLARAATAPVLEALGERAGEACDGPRTERTCPVCGGLPQLAYVATTNEDLVTAHRYLECSRCASNWAFTRLTCAACGEFESVNLLHFSELGALEAETSGRTVRGVDPDAAANTEVIVAEKPRLPHVHIEGCRTCSHYLLTIDASREPSAVPVVDELAALPLYVYAGERGLSKIVANQLGF